MSTRIETEHTPKTLTSFAVSSARAGIHCISTLFFKPRAVDEDTRRKERILTIILMGMIVLAVIAESFSIWQHFFQHPEYHRQSLWVLTAILLLFIGLFVALRKGYYRISAYVFLIFFFLIVINSSITWGVSLPMGILSYALLITMASIIISTRFGLVMTAASVLAIFIIGTHEANLNRIPEWKQYAVETNDLIEYGTILSVTALLSWLSNRELEKSLARTRASEETLQHERDTLEILVTERTAALRNAERERIAELYRFAEFGKRSAGLFHDLINPLTAISLTVEKLKNEETANTLQQEAHQSIANAVAITHRMEEYMSNIKRQIKISEDTELFSILNEIKSVKEFLRYQAREYGVALEIASGNDIELTGNPLKFNQIISNLVANGIDAYEKIPKGTMPNRCVRITVSRESTVAVIEVKNYGETIPDELIGKLFTPFFTTKEKGIGLGLATTKDIVEKDFKGTITLTNEKAGGTIFTVRIPLSIN